MDSELNKLFGRDFLIGFFLPSLLFVIAGSYVLQQFGRDTPWMQIDWEKPLEGAAFLAAITWGIAIFLQALNREIFRFAEGYWPSWLWNCSQKRQRCRFLVLRERVDALRGKQRTGLTIEEESELIEKWEKLATRFPSKIDLVLPTSFGNVVRASEDYSRIVYGFESINGWCRLQAFMSKEFREEVSRDKARVDLWLNLCLFSLLVSIGLLLHLCCHEVTWLGWMLFLLGPLMAMVAYARALRSAEQFGEQVKAAFDLYLPELAHKLGFELSSDVAKNQRFWNSYTDVMLFPEPVAFQRLVDVGLKRVSSSLEWQKDSGGEENEDE